MIETIHELTIRSGAWQETTGLVSKLNRALRGWANYFDPTSTVLRQTVAEIRGIAVGAIGCTVLWC
jgi:hypothetical protein